MPQMREQWRELVPGYRRKRKLDVAWCGSYKVVEIFNKGENVKLDTPPFYGLRVFNRDSIKPNVHRERQPMWECPMPPVNTGPSPRLVEILRRRRVGSRKHGTWLYEGEWDENTWSCESSKTLDENPVHLEFFDSTLNDFCIFHSVTLFGDSCMDPD